MDFKTLIGPKGLFASLIIYCITLLSTPADLFDPLIRRGVLVIFIFWGCCGIITALKRQTRQSPILAATGESVERLVKLPRWRVSAWVVLFVLSLCFLVADLGFSTDGTFDIASVKNVKVLNLRAIRPQQDHLKTPIEAERPKLPQSSAAPSPPQQEFSAPPADLQPFVHAPPPPTTPEQNQPPDSPTIYFETAGVISESHAKKFYESVLGEAISFDLQRRWLLNQFVVDDIVVTVEKWEPEKPLPIPTIANIGTNIIVVEIDKLNKPLPWEFRPKYLLNDPDNKKVLHWHSVQLVLNRTSPERFLVKVGAKQPGKYTYSMKAILKHRFGVQEHSIIKHRVCQFFKPKNLPIDTQHGLKMRRAIGEGPPPPLRWHRSESDSVPPKPRNPQAAP